MVKKEHVQIKEYNPLVIEPEIIAHWNKHKTYQKTKEQLKGKPKFYFLDGPPYTSGKVHLGTAWNKSLKDCIIRYKRMQGFDVFDRAGYDMHGLPTENATQKKLGLNTKADINKFGVQKFIEECRKLCTENLLVMNEDFKRLGVWMDFDNAYQSITPEFIEGEWWLIKTAHEKGRLYEGQKSMHWCGNCQTSLSKHELEYENVVDNSIFMKFKVKNKENEYLIVWTTTPWTIPFNLAVMVNPGLDYVKAKVDDEVWIAAKALVNSFLGAVVGKKYQIIEEFKGDKLEGLAYEHPFDKEIEQFFHIREKAKKLHTVLLSTEYVDVSAGSGLVHVAPGCGPEDFEIGKKNGLPPFNEIDENGVFPLSMGIFHGLKARRDDDRFVEIFKKKGAIVGEAPVQHDYPYHNRCHLPVVFRTTTQWFFKVEDLVPQMIKENDRIKWVPEAAYNAFSSWLKNLRDNGITRQRYWGAPLPIWRCDKCKEYVVVGSRDELKKLAGKIPKDLHIPYIDAVTFSHKCGGTMKRLPDVLDVWIDAGTTSWNDLDYPQKKELFNKLFPADFILEGKDQIRGWFNLLMVASMIAFGKPSFKAVYMHAYINDAQGRKMSKSLGNYIVPEEVVGKYGADTFRYYTTGGAAPAVDLNYNFEDMKLKYRNLGVLWNVHKYLIDYAKTSRINPAKLDKKKLEKRFALEERYIFSKLNSAIKKITEMFDEYRLNETPWIVEDMFLELSRTYIQLIRDKINDEDERDVVIYAIYRAVMDVLKMFAPICPYVAERMYLNLKDAFGLKEPSIHMADWPKADDKEIDTELEKNMAIAQNVIQGILSAREKMQLGLRWPLQEAIIVTKDKEAVDAVKKLSSVISSQTNVKDIRIKDFMEGLRVSVKGDFAKLGPDFGELTPAVIAHITTTSPESIMRHIDDEGKYSAMINGKKIELLSKHLIVTKIAPEPYVAAGFKLGDIYVNSVRSEELEAEGYAREVMRRIQSARKEHGLSKSDEIELFIKVDPELRDMIDSWDEELKKKVGAESLEMADAEPKREYAHSVKDKIKNKEIGIYFNKI